MDGQYPDLQGKHVLITGGVGGIGGALSETFAAQGCRVTALDRDPAGVAFAERCNRPPEQVGRVRFMLVDLMDEAALVRVLKDAQQVDGPVDVLINNAGYDPRYDITKMTMQQWDELFRLNVGHYFVTCRELIPAMKARSEAEGIGASIILVSSVNWWLGGGDLTCYTATKAAVIGMMKSLAAEVGKWKIRVNAIAPGWTMTERQLKDLVTPEIKRKLVEEMQLLPELLTPENLAPAFLFLASEASRMITRQTLLVDGGLARG